MVPAMMVARIGMARLPNVTTKGLLL